MISDERKKRISKQKAIVKIFAVAIAILNIRSKFSLTRLTVAIFTNYRNRNENENERTTDERKITHELVVIFSKISFWPSSPSICNFFIKKKKSTEKIELEMVWKKINVCSMYILTILNYETVIVTFTSTFFFSLYIF